MTTSSTTAFNLDLNDLVEEAFERCGKELRTGYDLRTARRSLNLLTIEWANRGITVNAIAPSYFETDINKDSMADKGISQLIMSKTPVNRWGKVEELVGLVIYLASDASSYMTGSVIPLDGGWAAG